MVKQCPCEVRIFAPPAKKRAKTHISDFIRRYHPSDLVLKDCTHRMAAIRKESNGDKDALVKCFRAIRQKFHPVLRHYFTERHKVPQAWFEMRLRYSRSVAVSSIIGHILGLGDRHISNILLDNGTGEVVHIDLGIAFEQVCLTLSAQVILLNLL